jgi:pilus assembly protein TadC
MPDPLALLASLAAGAVALFALPPVSVARSSASPRKRFLRRHRRGAGADETADAGLLLELTAALLSAGVGIEAALARLSATVPGAEPLTGVHRALAAGVSWGQAAGVTAEYPQLRVYCDHLGFAYGTGAPSARMLRAAARRVRSELRHEAEAEAEKLGVKMMLPLGTCFLPAFVMVGVVPVVASMLPEALGF